MEELRAQSATFVRWEVLTYLGLANFLANYCFYLPGSLFSEGAVSIVTPQLADFAWVGSFLTFLIGLAARPIGAVFFGLEGDSRGSKRTLIRSGYLLGLSTAAIAFVPSVEVLGFVTPILNIILRMFQGFAIGGTYSSIALLAYDAAPNDSKGRLTCFIQVTAPAGYLGSLAMVLITKIIFGEQAFANWGWRICFLASFGLIYFVRLIERTPCDFEMTPLFSNKREVWESVKRAFLSRPLFRRNILGYILPISGVVALTTLMGTVYQLFFLQSIVKVEPVLAKFIMAVTSLIYLPTYFFWGVLSDRKSKLAIVFAGVAVSTVTLLPIYILMDYLGVLLKQQETLMGLYTWLMILVTALLSSIVIIAYSPLISYLGDILPHPYRNFLLATCYNFGFGVLGALSQFAGSYFLSVKHEPYGTIYVTTAFCFIGLAVIIISYYKNQTSQRRGMNEN